MKEKVSLFRLFIVFAKIGVTTFGGGMAMLPILIRELCESRKWTTEEEISDYFAIGQCTPGIIAVNTATFVGCKKRGIPGGVVATLGVVFPSLIIITVLAGILEAFSSNTYVVKAFLGIRACVCVLILNAVIKLAKKAYKGTLTLIIFLICGILSIGLSISPMYIVLGVIFASLVGIKLNIVSEANDE